MFHFLSKFFRDIVALGFAAFVGEKLCRGDEIVPLALGKSALDVVSGDVVLQQSVDESRIKVVACADGAHGVGLLYRIALGKAIVGSHFYGVLSLRIDKLAAIEADLCIVYLFCRGSRRTPQSCHHIPR